MAKYKFTPPKGILPQAEQYIKKVVKYLQANEQIDEVDDAALTMLAINYSLFLQASQESLEQGLTVDGSRGPISNPTIKVARDCQVQAIKLMEKYGLTSLDRRKLLEDDGVDEDSPLMQFINEEKEIR